MADSREVRALQDISTEVDESQLKVLCATKCIKAQAHLTEKLRKKAERLRETSSFMSRANLKLKSEITQAQMEIKSSLVAQDTINRANVELKKELLLAEDKKIEVIKRVKKGDKKYEDLWLESKARFESLPFVQRLLQARDEVVVLEQQTVKLDHEKKILIEKIKTKTEICLELDRKRIIELAEFLVNEMPNNLNIIRETSAAISELTFELNNLDIQSKATRKIEDSPMAKETRSDANRENKWPVFENINDRSSIMPKLQLSYLDFDALSLKLDEAKVKASIKIPMKETDASSSTHIEVAASKDKRNSVHTEEYSSFFNMSSVVYDESKPKSYSKMKLINILEDIQIDTNQAIDMIAKVNPETLHSVDSILVQKGVDVSDETLKKKDKKVIVSEVIEEIEMMSPNADLLLNPPTQFVDMSIEQGSQKEAQQKASHSPAESKSKESKNLCQALKTSQGQNNKKKVEFAIHNAMESNIISDDENSEMPEEMQTHNSQQDVSADSDDGFAKMQDMIMKRRNLELSPQFVYGKNKITPLNVPQNKDEVVTSKFFQDKTSNIVNWPTTQSENEQRMVVDDSKATEVKEIPKDPKDTENMSANNFQRENNPTIDKDYDTGLVSSPKRQKVKENIPFSNPMSGFQFSKDIPISESLDNSINTTGYEDGEEDYPRCIDSSLLLSPKADIPMSVGENDEVLSQDIPNFLSGLRKTSLSFFGSRPPSEPKPGSYAPVQGGSGFSFNFGGEEKKSRGGLFSMFK